MIIIRVHYFSEQCDDFTYTDIDVGLINFCETRLEELEYMLHKAIQYCISHDVKFNGFEIIAE